MDDLEVNPLYQALLGEFRNIFEQACKNCYVIVIPSSQCLEEVDIDSSLASHHILIPSKLLKFHFSPLQPDYISEIELDNNKLICHRRQVENEPARKFEVNILGQVVGYNQHHARYRVVVVDKLLFEPQPVSLVPSRVSLVKSFLASRFSPAARLRSERYRLRPPRPLIDHTSCVDFLESISQRVTTDLEADVRQFQQDELARPGYLSELEMRIRRLADCYSMRYENQAPIGRGVLRDLGRRDIQLSVENYIVYLLHAKLFARLQSYNARSDRRLLKRFQDIYASKLSICQLGAQEAFGEFSLSDELAIELVGLPSLQSPLSVVTSLVRSVDLIHEGLNQSIMLKNLTGSAELAQGERVSICSDDLIATFVYALAQVRPANLYTLSRYLDMFAWSSTVRDRPAYCAATFQLVIQYVFNYTGETTDNIRCSLEQLEDDQDDRVQAEDHQDDQRHRYRTEVLQGDKATESDLRSPSTMYSLIDSRNSLRESTSSGCSSPGNGSLRLDWDDV